MLESVSYITDYITNYITYNFQLKYLIIFIILLVMVSLYIKSIDTYKYFNKFKIILYHYNSDGAIKKTLQSIVSQKYQNFEVLIIDDKSTNIADLNYINKFMKIYNNNNKNHKNKRRIKKSNDKYKLLKINRHIGDVYCYALGLNALKCKSNDVIILMESSDWFIKKDALKIIRKKYSTNAENMMTLGSSNNFLVGLNKYVKNVKYLNNLYKNEQNIYHIMEKNNFRENEWLVDKPITFKYHLWKHFNRENLLAPNKKFFNNGYQYIYTLPLLEMIQGRFKIINEYILAKSKANNVSFIDNNINNQSKENLNIIRSYPKNKSIFETPLESYSFID